MTKKQPFYTSLNFNPGDLRRGRNRKAPAPPSRSPDDRASDGSGAKDRAALKRAKLAAAYSAINPINAGASPGLTAKDIAEIVHLMSVYGIASFRGNGLCSCPKCVEEQKPPKLETVVTSGEIISHRMWLLGDDSYLYSIVAGKRWLPGETIAGDLDKVVAMSWGGPIYGGVYSYKNRAYMIKDQHAEGAVGYLGIGGAVDSKAGALIIAMISGTIKSWGEVIEHEHGYRSSFAKINTLDEVYSQRKIDLNPIRQRYGVLK